MASEITPIMISVMADMRSVEKQFDQIERSGKTAGQRTGQSFNEGTSEATRFERGLKATTAAASGLALIVASQGASAMRGFLGWIGRTTTSLLDFGAIGVLKVSQGLRVMAEDTRDAEGDLTALGKTGVVAASGLEIVARTALAISGAITGLQIGLALLAGTIVTLGVRASSEFTPSWNKVRTLLGSTTDELPRLRQEVISLSAELGVDLVESTEAYYQILSAMPALVKDSSASLGVLRAVLKATSSGFTTAAEAGTAITAVINSFGLATSEAERVSSALFIAQDQGDTTFGEIAGSIGQVADLTASLGGEFTDLLAILGTLTDSGVETNERIVQFRGVLSAIIKPTEQAKEALKDYDVELSATSLNLLGVNGYLIDLIEETKGNPDLLAKVFPQESLGLVLALASRTEQLKENMEDYDHATDRATTVVEIMNQSWARQKEFLSGEFNAALVTLGLQFEGVGAKGLGMVNVVVAGLRNMRDELSKINELSFWDTWALLLNPGDISALIPLLVALRDEASSELTTLPAVHVTSDRARPEPAPTLDSSKAKISDLEGLLRARAVVDFAATGNMEAYEAATRRAQERVNALVISEMERLRAAGLEEAAIAELAGSYQVLGNEGVDAIKRLREQAAGLDEDMATALAGLTETIADESLLALDRLEEEIRAVYEGLGEDVPPALLAGLQRLRDNVAAEVGLEDLSKEADEMLLGKTGPAMVAQLEEFISRLEAERDALEEGTEVRARYTAEVERMEKALASAKRELEAEAGVILQKKKEQSEDLVRSEEERVTAMRETARAVEENVQAALQLAEAFGVVSEETAAVLSSVVQLGASIARLAAGDMSAIGPAIGATAQLGSAILGESPLEKERKDLLKQNQETLERIELNTRGFRLTANILDKYAKNIDAFMSTGARVLDRTGTEALAREFGIQLYDSEGTLLTSALEQLRRAIELAQGSITGWGESLDDERGRLDLEADVFDVPMDAADKLAREFGLLTKFAPDLVKKFDLVGLDLGSSEGRTRLEAGLRDIFKSFSDGTIDIGNLTRDEFLSIFGNLEKLIDEIAGETGVTQSFQVARSITEVTGNRLYAAMTTGNFWAEQTAHHTALMNEAMREMLAGRSIPASIQPQASLLSSPAGIVNTFGDINISVVATPGSSAEDVGRMAGIAIVDAVDEQLGRRFQQMRRYRGDNRA